MKFVEEFSFKETKEIKNINLGLKYSENFLYQPSEICDLNFKSCEWYSPLVFSNIPFDDFFFLMIAHLLEIPIILNSYNEYLVTYTVYYLYK